MKRWLMLGAAALCLGTACGTTQTQRTSLQAAPPLTAVPLREKGEEAASASGASSAATNAPPAQRHFQKWNPVWWFGNVDDPEPPEWYRPGSRGRRPLWQLRNPLHNFTFYVIGIADKPFTRSGKFPDSVFAPDGGWNRAVARYKCVRLPFISFSGNCCQFYFGWRERGNFGCKVNFGSIKTPDARRRTPAENE